MWIESHSSVGRHPKTRALARRLGVGVPQAVGHLHLLWHWALEFAEDGAVGRYGVEAIADGAGWEGDPEAFATALIASGYLDEAEGELVLHDWLDYAGRYLGQRERKRRQRAEERDALPAPGEPPAAEAPAPRPAADGHVTVTGPSQDRHVTVTGPSRDGHALTVPNLTRPHRTQPNREILSLAPGDAAEPATAEAPGAGAPARGRDAPGGAGDALFEAVVEVCYDRPYREITLTKAERGRVNAALRDLREVGATPEEVRRRAANYRARFPRVELTPTALASHWARCAAPPARAAPVALEGTPARPGTSLEVALRTLAQIREVG